MTYVDAYATTNTTDAPGSAPWWLKRLEDKLRKRRPALAVFDDYYEGNQPLAFASEKFLKAFGGLFEAFADNWCALVIDAVDERLRVDGFRLDADKEQGDDDAWRIWQANNLDSDSQIAHNEALISGECSALVWSGVDDQTPSITIEHPREMYVETAAGNRRHRTAALKEWTDDTGVDMATLYLPDAIYKYRSRTKAEQRAKLSTLFGKWIAREVTDEPWPLPNPLGVVPVIPICNRPRLLKPGVSEIKTVIPIQNAVNKLLADMVIASEYSAYRQRWVTGLEIETDPETGQEIEPFRSAIDRLFQSEDNTTKFGEFGATDLSNFVTAIEMIVQHIASQTRTPPHYFYLSGQFPSGESIKSAETGLVAKTRKKMLHFGESWEQIVRLGFAVIDDPRQDAFAAETIWADPESRTESEHVDACVKLLALKVPLKALWERVGFSQTQQARFIELLVEQEATPALALAEPQPTFTVTG